MPSEFFAMNKTDWPKMDGRTSFVQVLKLQNCCVGVGMSLGSTETSVLIVLTCSFQIGLRSLHEAQQILWNSCELVESNGV